MQFQFHIGFSLTRQVTVTFLEEMLQSDWNYTAKNLYSNMSVVYLKLLEYHFTLIAVSTHKGVS